jgi:hypothetical protein
MESMESSDQSAIDLGQLFMNLLKTTNIVVYNPSTHTAITAQGVVSHQKHALVYVSLSNYIIQSCNLTKSVLKGCLIVNSELRDCILDDCKLADSLIYNSSFNNCSRSKCFVSPLPYLYRIPREIRDKIFSEAIEWNGTTPVLIAALRGDPVLYQEALRILSKKWVLKFHSGNIQKRNIALPTSFRGIERIRIK